MMLGVNAVVGALSLSAFNLEVRTNRFKLGKQEEERERERESCSYTSLATQACPGRAGLFLDSTSRYPNRFIYPFSRLA